MLMLSRYAAAAAELLLPLFLPRCFFFFDIDTLDAAIDAMLLLTSPPLRCAMLRCFDDVCCCRHAAAAFADAAAATMLAIAATRHYFDY